MGKKAVEANDRKPAPTSARQPEHAQVLTPRQPAAPEALYSAAGWFSYGHSVQTAPWVQRERGRGRSVPSFERNVSKARCSLAVSFVSSFSPPFISNLKKKKEAQRKSNKNYK